MFMILSYCFINVAELFFLHYHFIVLFEFYNLMLYYSSIFIHLMLILLSVIT